MAIKLLAFVNEYCAYKSIFFIQEDSPLSNNKISSFTAPFFSKKRIKKHPEKAYD